MEDIETIVRSIVAQSDVNILTKRMVRTEYRKLTGTTSLPGAQKMLINSLLDKIVGELAQEVSPSVQSSRNSNKDRDSNDHVQTTESRDHNTQTSESRVDNDFGCSETTKHNPENFQTVPIKPADVYGCESPQSQHMATAGRTDQKSPNSSDSVAPPTRPRLLTTREAMSVVLDSDSDDNHDCGDSDSQGSPPERTAVKTLKILNVNQNFKGQNKEVHSKRASTIYIESSDSTEEFLPAKKCKIQNEDKQEIRASKRRDFVSSDSRRSPSQDGLNKSRSRHSKTQVSAVKHGCITESSASAGSSDISLMIDVSSSPCNSGSETMLATDAIEANSGSETMLATDTKVTSIPHNLLRNEGFQQKFKNKMSRGKFYSREPRDAGSPVNHFTPRDAGGPVNHSTPRDTGSPVNHFTPIDAGSPVNHTTHRDTGSPVNHSTPRKTSSPDIKSKMTVNSKLPNNYSSGLPLLRLKLNGRPEKGITNSETTTSDSDLNEVLLLESCVSDSDHHPEVSSAALCQKRDQDVRVCADSDCESESVQPPGVGSFQSLNQEGSSGQESDADDSFATCFKVKRIGSNRKSKFVIDSDSDSQMSCRSVNQATMELKRNFKPRFTVMIKNISESDDTIDVIKNAVISDSEVLESLENQCSKTTSGKLKEDRIGSNKHTITKKKRSTVTERNVLNCTKNKKPPRKQSVTRGGDLAKNEESSCWKYLSDSSDENDLPLSVVKAHLDEEANKFNTANGRIVQAKSSHQTPKRNNGQQFIYHFDKENNSPDSGTASLTPSSRNETGSRCASRVNSSPDGMTSNSPKEKRSPLEIVAKCSVKKTSCLFSRKSGSVTSDSISEDEDERADAHQQVTTTTSVLSSEQNNTDSSTSSMSDSDQDTCTVTTKESPEKKQQKHIEIAELTRLRKICRTVGLILRNSKELLGCDSDQDKVARIRQLLKERGMEGKPTLQKANQLNLIKEMQELQCKDVTSNSQDKGTHSGRPKRRVARDIFTLSPVKRHFSSRNFCDTFSELQGVITVDESDSS